MAINNTNRSNHEKEHLIMGADLNNSVIEECIFDLKGNPLSYDSVEYELIYKCKDEISYSKFISKGRNFEKGPKDFTYSP